MCLSCLVLCLLLARTLRGDDVVFMGEKKAVPKPSGGVVVARPLRAPKRKAAVAPTRNSSDEDRDINPRQRKRSNDDGDKKMRAMEARHVKQIEVLNAKHERSLAAEKKKSAVALAAKEKSDARIKELGTFDTSLPFPILTIYSLYRCQFYCVGVCVAEAQLSARPAVVDVPSSSSLITLPSLPPPHHSMAMMAPSPPITAQLQAEVDRLRHHLAMLGERMRLNVLYQANAPLPTSYYPTI